MADTARLILQGELMCVLRRAEARLVGRHPPLAAEFKPRTRQTTPRFGGPAGARPRVLFAGPSQALQGAPISQFELTVGLREQDAVEPVSILAAGGPLGERYRLADLPVEIDPSILAPAHHPWTYERAIAGLAKRLEQIGPDLVFVNTVDCFPVVDAAALVGIPSIWNIREGEHWRQRFADRTLHVAGRALACFGYPASVVFVSEETRQRWLRFDSGRFTVIPNAVRPFQLTPEMRRQTRDALGLEDRDRLLLNVGTLCARKGQVDLGSALTRLDPDLRAAVAMVGDDPEGYGDLVLAATPAASRSRLRLLEPAADIAPLYAAADLFVATSRTEASARMLLEAAGCALPIVTTDAGDAASRLTDGVSARFYEAGDVAALARHVSDLLQDPDAAAAMGQRAQETVALTQAFDRMVRRYADVIAAAVVSPAAAAGQ